MTTEAGVGGNVALKKAQTAFGKDTAITPSVTTAFV